MDYSVRVPFATGEESREEKAKQIFTILSHYYSKKELKKMTVLDYGSSLGIIANYFSKYCKKVVGIDVDRAAITLSKKKYKKKNLIFKITKDERIPYKDESFDIVINNQVYNCVQDQSLMFDEIYRILKPGGICFLGARNKICLIESQYKLPFLSLLPKRLGDMYVQLSRKDTSFVGHKYKTYWGIKKLTSKFRLHDYTVRVLRNPKQLGFFKYQKFELIARLLPLKLLLFVMPNYLLILEKER